MFQTVNRAAGAAVAAAAAPARLAAQLVTPPAEEELGAGAPRRGAADADTDTEDGHPTGLAHLLELVDDGSELLEDVVEESVDLIEDSLGLHRRVWEDQDHEHAQIEVPAIADPAAVGLRQRLARNLSRSEGVRWAEVNAITSRVAVAFDGGESTLAALIEMIEGLEAAAGPAGPDVRPGWDVEERADHPADHEPVHRTIAIMAGDVASLGWSVVGRVARVRRLPTEVAGLVSIVDNNPWLRRHAQRVLGRRATALGLPLVAAVANGVAQGPLGTLVDLGLQAANLGELRARVDAWARREPEFYAVHSDDPIDPPDLPPRPEPLPDGPVESWSAWASGLGVGLAGVTVAASRDLRFSTDLLLASTPRAARLGREGFAAVLGRTLAARGIVPLDGSALRRLDRIDTVVLDAEVLVDERPSVRSVRHPSGEPAADRLVSVVERLFDPEDVERPRRWRSWRLEPLTSVDADVRRRARGAAARGREIRGDAGIPLALLDDGELVAVVDVGAEVDPVAEPVLAAVRDVDLHLVVADGDGRQARAFGADESIRSGPGLGHEVRRLQGEGRGVMVVGRQGHAGLAAADVGVGVVAATGRPSWGADLILGRELADVATIVRSVEVARQVSRRAARFAAAGSGLAALVSTTGPRRGAGARAMAVVNAAAGAALIDGMWAGVQLSHEPRPRTPDRSRWHTLPVQRVLSHLGSDADVGLASDEVATRRTAGRPSGPEVSPLEPFLAELANPLNPVLGIGAGLSAAAGSMADASLVLGLIGVNTAVGGVQRLRADRTVRNLLVGTVEDVTVVRDGREQRIPDDQLVRGDIVILTAGDAVPADARILASDGCEVDESSLTGESLPVTKVAEAAPDVELGDRTCMLYEDTTVVAGSARAVVVATGSATEVARSLALVGPPPRTGVELRLEELTRRLLPGALGVAAATGGVGLLRRWPFQDVAGTAVSLAIASVPEGLPFVATAGQLAGARRLAANGAVVRNPRTVEALGRVDVVCVDKTGTLTEGRVSLVGVSDGARIRDIDDLDDVGRTVLSSALLASDQPGEGRGLEDLDDADRALHRGTGRLGLDTSDSLGRWHEIDDLPFEATRGVHAVLGDLGGDRTVLVKGAPEALLAACDHWWHDGRRVPIDADVRVEIERHVDGLAGRGHRLLAVASRQAGASLDTVDHGDLHGLDLLGLIVLADRVRPTAAAAIRGIGDAGVRTVMVTGDHPETASAIATQLGLGNGNGVLVGAELDGLDDDALVQRLEHAVVVARVTPAHKQRIVQVLQGAGHVVAMTGDGANDAAAIRLAEVGVALGHRSSSAARDAADIVLADDRIETLIDAIAEGRALWGSIREALAVLVGGNLGEIGFTAVASAFSPHAPLHPRQFLLVNLFTDLAPAVAIAVRPPDDISPETLLREGPDTSLGGALRRDIAVRGTATALGAVGAWTAARLTGTSRHASTVGLAALVGTQLGQTLVAGGWRRPSTVITVAGSALTFVAAIQTPGVSRFFGSRPLGPLGWSQALTASAVATVGSELASRAVERLDLADEAGTDAEELPALPRRRRPVLEVRDRPARVLVTGASSTIGGVLVPRLLRQGHQVVCLVADPDRLDADWVDAVDVAHGDLDHEPSVIAAARDADVIYHLGANVSDGMRDVVDRARRRAGNLAGAAERAGAARVVHLGALLDEAVLHRAPDALYAQHEAAVRLSAGRVPVADVRIGPVLGRRDSVFRLLRAIARIPVHLDHPALHTRIQPVDVGELADLLADLASPAGPWQPTIEAAGPEAVTYGDLVEWIRAREGRARMIRRPSRRLRPEALAPVLATAADLPPSVCLALLQASGVELVADGAARRVPGRFTIPPRVALEQVWAETGDQLRAGAEVAVRAG